MHVKRRPAALNGSSSASNGKLKVQSKDDMKRDGHRSPDCADAFLLTFAVTPKPRESNDAHRREGRHRWYEKPYDWEW
jgi:hypothetical protein